MNRLHSWIKVLSTWCAGFLCALALGQAMAGVNGAIFTTDITGTIVNQNLYPAREAVYLTGGPQNQNGNGLVPDGIYYFQVTDPSGAVLLSLDDVTCRQVVVTNGNVVGVPSGSPPASCTTGLFHNLGIFNSSNGEMPVQLFPFDWTPNPGGEYKAWLTPVANYGEQCNPSHESFGFCDADSKTDNFKVAQPATLAHITACKFSDENDNNQFDSTEPLIPGWQITATNVEAGGNANATVTAPTAGGNPQDDGYGCVSFVVSRFTNAVTLTEVSISGWTQTAPLDGSYAGYSVAGGVVTTVGLKAGDDLTIYFGNFNPNCIPITNCSDNGGIIVSKDANPRFNTSWSIGKSADQSRINTSSTSAQTFNYTVTVTNTGDSNWMVNGTITLSNNGLGDLSGLFVIDSIDNGGTCSVTGGTNVTVEAGAPAITLPYSCTFTSNPDAGINTVKVYDSDPAVNTNANILNQATHPYDFAGAVIVDGTVNVTDKLAGTLGSVTYLNTPTCSSPVTCAAGSGNTATFNYSVPLTGTSGTCVTADNTATFTSTTTNSTTTGTSNDVTVEVCVGADLKVSKTATPAFNRTFKWGIKKAVDKTLVEQIGGKATFNYTVNLTHDSGTDGGWTATGSITVSNPNDWEDITGVTVTDAVDDGGSCTVTGGTNVTVPKGKSVTLPYSCTYSSAPSPTTGTNTATASWTQATFFTPDASANGTKGFDFGSVSPTLVDNCATLTDSLVTTVSGSACSTDPSPKAITYSYTVNVPATGCQFYNNTATFTTNTTKATGSDSKKVEVCGPAATGALTMGYWKNNGQNIIKAGASTSGVCNSGTWLRNYAPFQDLSGTATCSQVAGYVASVIGGATCGGTTCNAMLKAQMLATALDVYFSDPTLGGNKLSAPTPIGGVKVDLTMICPAADAASITGCEDASSAFGGTSPQTVSQMLTYAASKSNVGGSTWYGNVKATQVLAKDAFDAINNQRVFSP